MEPYLVDWKDVPAFLDWYNENVNDFFYGDTFFVFEDKKMISVLHHEGGFFHLYIGESLYPTDRNLAEWLNQEKKAQ